MRLLQFLSILLFGMSFSRSTYTIAGNSGPPPNDRPPAGAQPQWKDGIPPVDPPPATSTTTSKAAVPTDTHCFTMYNEANYGGRYKHDCTSQCINISNLIPGTPQRSDKALINYNNTKLQSMILYNVDKWGCQLYEGLDCNLQELGWRVKRSNSTILAFPNTSVKEAAGEMRQDGMWSDLDKVKGGWGKGRVQSLICSNAYWKEVIVDPDLL